MYLLASGLNDKSEDRKIAVFLHCIAEGALEIYNTLDIPYADPENRKMEEERCFLRGISLGRASLLNRQVLKSLFLN